MRLLLKLAMKLGMMVAMVLVMGSVMRRGPSLLMQVPGAPAGAQGGAGGTQFSSEEADLMSTVFSSAIRLFTGAAKRDELASELSDKLYAGRADSSTMSELGIELVKAGGDSAAPAGGAGIANAHPGASLPNAQPGTQPPNAQPGAGLPNAQPGAKPPNAQPGASLPNAQPGAKPPNALPGASPPANPLAQAGQSPADVVSNNVRTDLLTRIWKGIKGYAVELAMIPVVFLGMVLAHRLKRRSKAEDLLPLVTGILPPAESDPHEMKHAVHALGSEDFELLVALIYQRQGYRVSMPAGLGGGRGGDFTLLRKSERVLVQCKKMKLEHRVPVEKVRELHESMVAAGLTRGMYVASCGFTWDARNFAKARGMTLINARTLDELINAAREKPDEDLLAISQWAPKLMVKVELTTPTCPTCEAKMEQINVSDGSAWVCSQRPECRGRRSTRKYDRARQPQREARTYPRAASPVEK